MPLPPDVRPSICLAHPVAAGKGTTLPPCVDKWWGVRFREQQEAICPSSRLVPTGEKRVSRLLIVRCWRSDSVSSSHCVLSSNFRIRLQQKRRWRLAGDMEVGVQRKLFIGVCWMRKHKCFSALLGVPLGCCQRQMARIDSHRKIGAAALFVGGIAILISLICPLISLSPGRDAGLLGPPLSTQIPSDPEREAMVVRSSVPSILRSGSARWYTLAQPALVLPENLPTVGSAYEDFPVRRQFSASSSDDH
jgi:hypothetical protein